MRLFTFLCASVLAVRPLAGEAPSDPRLAAAIERALADNPDIAEMEHRIAAARARVSQASALPEPMLTAGAINVPVPSFSFQQDDMTMKMVSLEQEVPAPGKRGTSARVAQAQVEMARAEHSGHVNRLVGEVADSFFDIARADARLAITRRSLERAKRVSESVRSRYRVGQGTLPDTLLAGVGETKLADRIRALEAERAMAAARFNTLQGLPAEESVAPVPFLALDREVPDRQALQAAIERSPAVREARADIQRAEEELELARLQRRPDLKLMASYGQREGSDDMIGATVGFNLPFVRSRRVAARLALSREAEEAFVAIASEADRARLYRDTVLPQDQTAAQAAEEAYAVGKIDFKTYVGAVLALDEDEAEAVERETAIPRTRARLQAVTGFPFYGPTRIEENDNE